MHQREVSRKAELNDSLPKVVASADYGASGSDPGNAEKTYTLGAQVNLPIFEGGRRAARLREASSLVRESKARLQDSKEHVAANFLNAIESMRTAQDFVKAAHLVLEASFTQLSLARHRFATGLGSEYELTEATAQAIVAKDDYEEALAAELLSRVQLAHAMGNVESILVETSEVPK